MRKRTGSAHADRSVASPRVARPGQTVLSSLASVLHPRRCRCHAPGSEPAWLCRGSPVSTPASTSVRVVVLPMGTQAADGDPQQKSHDSEPFPHHHLQPPIRSTWMPAGTLGSAVRRGLPGGSGRAARAARSALGRPDGGLLRQVFVVLFVTARRRDRGSTGRGVAQGIVAGVERGGDAAGRSGARFCDEATCATLAQLVEQRFCKP